MITRGKVGGMGKYGIGIKEYTYEDEKKEREIGTDIETDSNVTKEFTSVKFTDQKMKHGTISFSFFKKINLAVFSVFCTGYFKYLKY